MSVSIIGVKTPTVPDTNNLYELDFDAFQLPERIITLDVLHRINHRTPECLNIPILNTNLPSRSIPDADILDEVRNKLKEPLNIKYTNIMSQTAKDIGRTNLIELDLPTEGPQ